MTTMGELASLVTFSASWAIFSAGHNVSDHLFGQTDWQATNKAAPNPEDIAAGKHKHAGWPANLAHVALYHLVLIVIGLIAWLALPLHWSATGIVIALVWSA